MTFQTLLSAVPLNNHLEINLGGFDLHPNHIIAMMTKAVMVMMAVLVVMMETVIKVMILFMIVVMMMMAIMMMMVMVMMMVARSVHHGQS